MNILGLNKTTLAVILLSMSELMFKCLQVICDKYYELRYMF